MDYCDKYWAPHSTEWFDRFFEAISARGHFWARCAWSWVGISGASEWYIHSYDADQAGGFLDLTKAGSGLGIAIEIKQLKEAFSDASRRPLPPGHYAVTIDSPYWLPAGLFAILPAIAAVKFVRKRQMKSRESQSLCTTCGYDLRATPNRCPECGTFAASGQSVPESSADDIAARLNQMVGREVG
jgi:hypothetical protein